MKYLSLLLLLILSACQPKEEKPELDYVRIEMFPFLGGPPSNINIDLKNNLITFSNLQQLSLLNEDCEQEFSKIQKFVEFVYIDLNDKEINTLKSVLDTNFYNSITHSNQELINNPKLYDGIRFDGICFEIDIVKDGQVFSTTDYLILEREVAVKIYEVLKIIKKHTNSIENKEYIDNLSFFLTDSPDQTNYKQKFP